MTVSLNRLAILLDDQNHVSVDNLILDIVHLENKLAHPEDQSFYFQKGISSVKERLANLHKEYYAIMKEINENSLEALENHAGEIELRLSDMRACMKAHGGFTSSSNAMVFQGYLSLFDSLMDKVATKKKYGQLKPLEELSPEERQSILDHSPYQEGT